MANFAIITKPTHMPALDYFRIGRNEYPERPTILVVQVDDILPAIYEHYSNSVVDNTTRLELKGVTENFWYQWEQLSTLYPLGLDIFFTCDDVLCTLPKVIV
jgi:alpha-D-ribose 1-methylphosphonate 5-triphosphate synthase subunit PhnH